MIQRGRVKWFDNNRGFGFIVPDDGSPDLFVHVYSLNRAGIRRLEKGQPVRFEVSTINGKPRAVGVELAGDSSST